MNFKRLSKYVAAVLLVTLCLTVPAQALTSSIAPVGSVVLPQVDEEHLQEQVGVSAGHRVSNVHHSASYGSTVIGTFKDGTHITVLGSKGDFYKIDCFDMNGYIAKSQVRKDEAGEYYVNCQADSKDTRYLPSYSTQNALSIRSAIVAEAQKYMGVPYVSGGSSKWGFDCTGFTDYVFDKCGVDISRSMYTQLSDSVIVSKDELQSGDLIFFSYTGDNGGFASHIGIYIGNGKLIHASYSRGIAIDDLSAPYYTKHFQCARRVILTDLAPSVSIPVTGLAGSTSAWRN